MFLPGLLKRLLGVSQPSTILPLPHLGLTLPFGRRCLTFICTGTGPDTSLVIQDEKITHRRTHMSSQTLRKNMYVYQNVGVKGFMCSVSVYSVASSLVKCKIRCAVPVFTLLLLFYAYMLILQYILFYVLGPFANFSSTYVSSQLKLGPARE